MSRRYCRLAAAIGAVVMLTDVAAHAAPDNEPVAIPARLQGLRVSGRALPLVADRIDPSRPLGYCDPADTKPRIRVIIPNVRNAQGNIRVSLYGSNPGQWVGKKGGKLIRFDVPAIQGRMEICMPLPNGEGTYGVGLYHDENGDNKYAFMGEGYGFSNNAKAGTFCPAAFKDAAFHAGNGTTDVDIRVRY